MLKSESSAQLEPLTRALAVRAALAVFGIKPSRMAYAGGAADRPGHALEARVSKE
jgi:hypothetical protein